jgi:hypothetical protein
VPPYRPAVPLVNAPYRERISGILGMIIKILCHVELLAQAQAVCEHYAGIVQRRFIILELLLFIFIAHRFLSHAYMYIEFYSLVLSIFTLLFVHSLSIFICAIALGRWIGCFSPSMSVYR